MKQVLRILHLEDDPGDAELVQSILSSEGIDCETLVVASREDFVAALELGGFDLILADFALPAFDGMTALKMVWEKYPDLPFIFVSGRLGKKRRLNPSGTVRRITF